eukprot:7287761-Pyramimonas_sp.AAC.1
MNTKTFAYREHDQAGDELEGGSQQRARDGGQRGGNLQPDVHLHLALQLVLVHLHHLSILRRDTIITPFSPRGAQA